MQLCEACARCQFVSLQPGERQCALFRQCDMSKLVVSRGKIWLSAAVIPRDETLSHAHTLSTL